MRIPSYFAGSGSPELAPAARCVSIASVRNPWAMVPPNGVAAARSGSTWMNWWSWVTSANWFTWSWVTSNHSPVPSSLPTSAWNRGNAFSAAALMPRTLGGPITRAPCPGGGRVCSGSSRSYRLLVDACAPGTTRARRTDATKPRLLHERRAGLRHEWNGRPGLPEGSRDHGEVVVGRAREDRGPEHEVDLEVAAPAVRRIRLPDSVVR